MRRGDSLRQAITHLQDAEGASDIYAFLFASAVKDLNAGEHDVLSALAHRTSTTLDALQKVTGLSRAAVKKSLDTLVTLSLVSDARRMGPPTAADADVRHQCSRSR